MAGTIVNKNGQLSSCTGVDAVDIYRIRTLMIGLKMIVESKGRMIPTRGFTLTKALAMASQYTGNKYKRTEGERAQDELKKIMELRLQHVEVVEA